MRIALCDDERKETESLKELMMSYSFKEDYEIYVDTFNNPEELLLQAKYDLYFLDYIMPQMNGVDLALKLREKFNNAVTICYLTSYDNAAIEVMNNVGYRMNKDIKLCRLM